VIGALAAAAVLLGVFTVVETQIARAPLVLFSAFRSRRLSAGNLLSFLSFVPVLPAWFFLTLYRQEVRGYAPLQAGLIFLPLSVAVAAGTQASFAVMARTDARLLFLAGGLTAAGRAAWLAQVNATGSPLWAVIVPACITMAGGGLMFAPITIAATSGAAPGQGGLASGPLNSSRQVGGGLGPAILGSVAAASAARHRGGSHASMSAGFAAAFAVSAGIFTVTAIAGALILPGKIGPPEPAPDEPSAGPGPGARRVPTASPHGGQP
jgi:hypothetical protein